MRIVAQYWLGRHHRGKAAPLALVVALPARKDCAPERTGPLRNAVLARRKSDDERKRSRVAPVVATKAVLSDYSHRLNVG